MLPALRDRVIATERGDHHGRAHRHRPVLEELRPQGASCAPRALAEELGYDSIWIPEAWAYEQFQLLTEIALATKRLKLATGIANVFSRSAGPARDERRDARRDLRGPRHPRARHERQDRGRELPRRAVPEAAHAPARDDRHPARALARRAARARAEHALRRAPLQARDDAAADATSRSTSRRCRRRRSARSAGIADGWVPTFWPYRHLDGRHRAARRGRARRRPRSGERSTWRRSSPSCRSTTPDAARVDDQAARRLLHRRHGRPTTTRSSAATASRRTPTGCAISTTPATASRPPRR